MEITDPVTNDPSVTDWAFPPSKAPLTINSLGSNLYGLVYIAQGSGPHPLAILLHGAGGYEKNLDLAQALRRGGWNALYFHYRGFWGSEGQFTLENALADVHAVIKYVGRPQFQKDSRTDAGRLAIIGHSLGGSLALMAGAEHATVTQIGFLSGANLALYASSAQENGEGEQTNSGPIQGMSWSTVEIAIGRDPSRYDLIRLVPSLDDKSILMVAGGRDLAVPKAKHHDPLVRALHKRNKASVTEVVVETDHDYSNARIFLARAILDWLA